VKHTLTLLTGLLLGPLPASATPPIITWGSDPLRPDEPVLLQGEGFGDDCVIGAVLSRDAFDDVAQPVLEAVPNIALRIEQ